MCVCVYSGDLHCCQAGLMMVTEHLYLVQVVRHLMQMDICTMHCFTIPLLKKAKWRKPCASCYHCWKKHGNSVPSSCCIVSWVNSIILLKCSSWTIVIQGIPTWIYLGCTDLTVWLSIQLQNLPSKVFPHKLCFWDRVSIF